MSTFFLALTILVCGGVIKDDFVVNSDPDAKCDKSLAFGAPTATGWYVSWVDDRNASPDIYGQALSSTLALSGENEMLCFDSTNLEEATVGVVSDSLGNVIVMWQCNNAGMWDYHLRKVSPAGIPLVKDTLLFTLPKYCYASVAMNAKGEYALAWQDADYVGIAFFNPDGSRKAEWQQVALNEPSPNVKPRVAIASNGATIVTWQDQTTLPPDTIAKIYARCYNTRCEPRGEVFEVASYTNDFFVKPSITSVAVGADHAGRFVISWVINDGSLPADRIRLYARFYSWDGSAHDPAREIAKGVGTSHKLAVCWDGSFCVAWSDNGVQLQGFYADGSKRGPELTLGPSTGAIQDLTVRSDEWFAVYSTETDMYGIRGMVQGSVIGTEMLINDDEGSTHQATPQVLASDAGDFVVFWSDEGLIDLNNELIKAYPDSDYIKCFGPDGSPRGSVSFVNAGPASMNLKTGEFVKSWTIQMSDFDYYLRRYSSTGQPQGDSIQINPHKLSSPFYKYVNVSANRKGSVVTLYSDGNSPRKLFARRFDKNNIPIDAEAIAVTPSLTASTYHYLDVAMREDNGFIATFLVRQQGLPSFYVQPFDKNGIALSDPVAVNENAEILSDLRPPSIAVDTNGNYCVAWCASGTSLDRTIYAQCFDASGQKLGTNLNTGILTGSYYNIGIAARPSGGYVVFGTDYSDADGNPEVSAYCINKDGTAMGRKIQINDPDLFCANYQIAGSNSVAATDERIVYTWLDNRRNKGWDVFAKITDWDVPGIEEPSSPLHPATPLIDVESGIGSTITLRFSNFPGGFRASVFDASGRKVDEVRTVSTSGTILWGEGRNAGVYFAVPDWDVVKPLKIVLVK